MSAIEDYCIRHTSTAGGPLNDIYRSVALHTANPHMASSPLQGGFLQMLAAIRRPEVAVEIGAHAGYGSACIASGMGGDGILHLVESNPEYQTLICRHAEMAGISDRIRLHIGQAKVTSAIAIDDEMKQRIKDKLISTTDYKEIEIDYETDPSLIGGMVIRIKDRIVDNSVKTKLENITRDLHKIQI